MDVSSEAGFAISCGSDNVLVKYNLSSSLQGTPEVLKVSLKANGMADGKIRSDEKIIALAGWDGRYDQGTPFPLLMLQCRSYVVFMTHLCFWCFHEAMFHVCIYQFPSQQKTLNMNHFFFSFSIGNHQFRIRLFSSKTLKPLAVLKYHREGLYCLGLADIEEQQVRQQKDEVPSSTAPSDNSVVSASTLNEPGTATSTADAIITGENDNRGSNDDRSSDESGSESDNDGDSGDDSGLEDALADRQRWSTRHWIAVGGKEQRISLWDIY